MTARLNSDEHLGSIERVDLLNEEPFISFREERRRVEQAQGINQVKLWLEYRIQEPRFDDADAQMPNLGIPQEVAARIATYLVGEAPEIEQEGVVKRTIDKIRNLPPTPTRANAKKYGLALTGLGFIAGVMLAILGYWLLTRLRKRSGSRRT